MHVELAIAFITDLAARLTDIMNKCRQVYHVIFYILRKFLYCMQRMLPQIVLVGIVLLIETCTPVKLYQGNCIISRECKFKDYTMQALLGELGTIEYYQQPGKAHHRSEITEKQLKLYELMDLPVHS